VTLDGTADGSTFQTVGRLLSTGDSTIVGDLDETFVTATGTGGVQFLDADGGSGTDNWDDGLVGERAQAGLVDGASVVGNGGVTAQACTTCGVAGGAAGQLIVEDIDVTAGFWVASLYWIGYDSDLSDLTQATLSADIKGTADGVGQSLGTYALRIEDPDLDFLEFTVTADGSFQSVGGALSGASPGAAGNGDGIINRYAEAYTVSVLFEGDASNWGTGGTLTVDNLFLDGIDLKDAQSYTVTLEFEDEVATWGTGGNLKLDNLMLVPAVNPDGDNAVDVHDFAYLQRCMGVAPVSPGCECADLDGDDDVDGDDLVLFDIAFGGPR
jgi:hypothetical protein